MAHAETPAIPLSLDQGIASEHRARLALMLLSGVCWLTFAWPPLGAALAPYNAALGALGEAALTLWLLFRGVNPERWQRQAAATSS